MKNILIIVLLVVVAFEGYLLAQSYNDISSLEAINKVLSKENKALQLELNKTQEELKNVGFSTGDIKKYINKFSGEISSLLDSNITNKVIDQTKDMIGQVSADISNIIDSNMTTNTIKKAKKIFKEINGEINGQ